MSSLTVGIRELKSHLSAYVRRVRAGETVVVTDRGTPVVRLMPMRQSTEATLQHLEEAGVLAWSGRKLTMGKAGAPAVRGDRSVADLLLEDRD
jgi:prevent-host-death family protein